MNNKELVSELLQMAQNLGLFDENGKDKIIRKADMIIKNLFPKSNYSKDMHKISFYPMMQPSSYDTRVNRWESGQNKLINLFEIMIEEIELFSGNNSSQINQDENEETVDCEANNKIFIVHGHNDSLKYNLANWLREIDLEPIILHEQASVGCNTIINKLERYSDVLCAIVLMTADDLGKEKNEESLKCRARQNVVFEAGLFIGKHSVDRVILLCDEGVEIPGDLSGCVHITADPYDGWRGKVLKEFKAMGIK
jgi:predicted nucleotide-binding protein